MPDLIRSMLADPVPAVGALPVRNPYDDSEIASVELIDHRGVESALRVADALHRDRSNRLPTHRRIEILRCTADLMEGQAEELAQLASREGGKPLRDSRAEVSRAIDGVRNCAELARHHAGREIPMGVTAASAGRLAFTTHEPRGPVVAISAFNHPLNLIVHQVAPAVAAACPVIVKPAEDTPLSCFKFIELLEQAGLPQGHVQALMTDTIATAEQLVTDPRVAFLSFIGSARVGWHLRSRLAPGTRCALEHGGAAPVIVDKSADLEQLVPLLAKGGFYHAGQVCVSAQRVFVDQSIASDLADALTAAAQAQTVGNPLHDHVDIGPLIRHSEVDRVDAWVNEAHISDAHLLTGGRLSKSCYAATVLWDPPSRASVSHQEIFGPVLCVYPYQNLKEAIARANALPFAFQSAVFSRDIEVALKVASQLEASAVMINDHTAFRTDWMPFAGLKQSGLGTGGIPHTYHDMQIEKMLVFHSPHLADGQIQE